MNDNRPTFYIHKHTNDEHFACRGNFTILWQFPLKWKQTYLVLWKRIFTWFRDVFSSSLFVFCSFSPGICENVDSVNKSWILHSHCLSLTFARCYFLIFLQLLYFSRFLIQHQIDETTFNKRIRWHFENFSRTVHISFCQRLGKLYIFAILTSEREKKKNTALVFKCKRSLSKCHDISFYHLLDRIDLRQLIFEIVPVFVPFIFLLFRSTQNFVHIIKISSELSFKPVNFANDFEITCRSIRRIKEK